MKAISPLITVILVLLIGVSLSSLVYMFFADLIVESTVSGTEAAEETSRSLLAEMKIGDLAATNVVPVRNTGKVSLSDFNVYVNGDFIINDVNTILPGETLDIDIGIALNSGDMVKVTSAEGAEAYKMVP